MLILTIRTDQPQAEIGLFDDDRELAYATWPAHRQLAETIHLKIQELLQTQKHDLADTQGLIVFQGPGSFTGLRIGISVANALAASLKIPIVGEAGNDWLQTGKQKLRTGHNDQLVAPEYGASPRTTLPKH